MFRVTYSFKILEEWLEYIHGRVFSKIQAGTFPKKLTADSNFNKTRLLKS